MAHEIYYTSAPEGLKRGSSGFCSVAASDNIPKPLWDRLEALSAYRHHFGVASTGNTEPADSTSQNPTSHAHWLLNVTGTTYHVLSRICDSGVDHTQRSNAFAHHLVVDPAEMAAAAAGPAWMLDFPNVMQSAWNNHVGTIPRHPLPAGDREAAVCHAWASLTGDPGWGGLLADLFIKSPAKPVCILFAPGQNILPLLAETIALLPPAARWNVTFNTYFTSMPTSATCTWRCCLAGTPAAQVGLRYAAAGIVIDLTDPSRLGSLPEGPYVTYARTGQPPPEARPPITTKPTPALKTPAKPTPLAPTTPALDILEEDEDEDPPFDPDIHEITPTETPPLPNATTPNPQPPRPRPSTKKKPSPTLRAADQALRAAEGEAAKAAAARRRQILWLFSAAIAAIALGTILVIVAFHNGAPADLPSLPKPPATPHAAATPPSYIPPIPTTAPPIQPPPPPPEIARIIPQLLPPITPPTPAVQLVPQFPALLTLTSFLQPPTSGQGFSDFSQTLLIPPSEFDTTAKLTAIRLHFPASASEPTSNTSEFPYKDGISGTAIATSSRRLGLPIITLSWKDASSSSDILDITLNPGTPGPARKPTLDLHWNASPLVKHPDVVRLLLWILQTSTIELQNQRGDPGQHLAFKQPAPIPISLLDNTASLSLPAPLPADAAATPPSPDSLPAGWDAAWYTEWTEKDVALRTAANGAQVIKFHKATAVYDADAWFLLRFSPTFDKIENTLPQQIASAAAALDQAQSDARDIQTQIDEDTRTSGGKLPDTDSTKMLLKKRDQNTALISAYKDALSCYNNIHSLSIPLSLPNGLKLTTLTLSRPPPNP